MDGARLPIDVFGRGGAPGLASRLLQPASQVSARIHERIIPTGSSSVFLATEICSIAVQTVRPGGRMPIGSRSHLEWRSRDEFVQRCQRCRGAMARCSYSATKL